MKQTFQLMKLLKNYKAIADSCETVLLCDDLDHMKRGGRLTPMAAALGVY